MQNNTKTKIVAWILSICLIITLIPDIGYATETSGETGSQTQTETSQSAEVEESAEQRETETAETTEQDNTKQEENRLDPEIADDPAMEGLTEDDVVEKTETTTTYDIGNGMKAKVLHGGEVRFENEDGELVDYDPSLVRIKDGEKTDENQSLKGYEYRNKEGDKKQYLPETLSENTPILMEYDGHRISIVPTDDTVRGLGISSRTAEVREDIVPSTYEGEGESLPVNAVYGQESDPAIYTYTSGDAGIKETLTLNEKPETNVFTYEIDAGELLIKENTLDEGITFIDPETDDIVAAIEAPWMNDATGDAYSTDITYGLEKIAYEEGLYSLTMTIDEEYLSDEDTVYPVTVDPTVTWKGNDMIRDTYIIYGSGYAGTNFYDTSITKMPVGTNSTGRHRTLFKLLNLKAEIEGKSVASAKLTLYESGTGASGQTIRANRITEDWTVSTVTWNNQPAYNTAAYTAQVTTSGTKNTAKVFDCTAFAKNVSNGTSNYGLILRNMTTDPSYACFWGSRYATTAYRPKLVVTYYDRPTTFTSATLYKDTGSSYEPTQYFQKGDKVYVSWKGASAYSFSAIQYRFEGFTSADVVPTSASSDGIDLTTYRSIGKAAASATYKNVPYAKYLPEGKFKLFMRTKDAAGYTSSGKYKTVVVDSTAPDIVSANILPVTSSSNYSSDTEPVITCDIDEPYIKEVMMSINGGPAFPVSDLDKSEDEKYQVTAGKITKSGKYTIKIHVYDRSGNVSEKGFDYYVDVDPPVITEMAMTPETTSSAPSKDMTPTLTWKVTDNDFKSVTFYVNNYQEGYSESKEGTLTFDSNVFPDNDVYLVEMVAEDNCGRTTEESLIYYLDVFAPNVQSITMDPDTTVLNTSGNKSPMINWNIYDDYSMTVYYSLDKENWTEMGTDSKGSFNLPTDTWSEGNGTYTVYVKAVDYCGNETLATELTYHYNESGSYALKDLSATEYYGKRFITWGIDALDPDNFQYDIHRGTTAGFTPNDTNCIAEDIDAASKLYIDNEVLSEGTYYYKITVSERNSSSTEVLESNEASIVNTITAADFKNTLGNKEYLSYTSVELPIGTATIEESSGNLLYGQTDFDISNAQLDYSMERTYNSGSDITSMVGSRWTDSYHKELYRSGEDIYFRDSDGSSYLFEYSNNAYSCEETKEYTLAQAADGDGYTITTKEDIVYKFNEYGQLIETSEPNGCAIINDYDEKGRLVKVISQSDNGTAPTALTLAYEGDSYILKDITDPMLTTYNYTVTDGNLEEVTIKGTGTGEEISYQYDYNSDGLLSVIYDGDDEPNKYAFTYSSGKVSKVAYPDNEYLQFTYGSGKTILKKYAVVDDATIDIYTEETTYDTTTGKVITHKDPKEIVTTYSYKKDAPYLVETESTDSEYESISSDGTISKVPRTDTITYTYDTEQNMISESESDGTVTTYAYEDENNENLVTGETTTEDGTLVSEEHYQYDALGNMESSYDTVTETQSFYLYNKDGNETDCIEFENVNTEVDLSEDENVDLNSIKAFQDNIEGEEVLRTDSKYDGNGNEICHTTESSEIGSTTKAEYDAMGRVISSTENGVTTAIAYDFLGRAVKVTVSEDGKDDIVTSSTYNGNGSLVAESTTGGVYKYYDYDSRNRNILEKTTGSDIDQRVKKTAYSYAEGEVIKDGRNGRAETCYVETVTDSADKKVSVTYIDNAGSTVKTVAGDLSTYYTYDKAGNQTVSYTEGTGSTDHMLNLQLYDIDRNNFANVSQPTVSGSNYVISGDSSIATYSTYDEKGNLKSSTDANGVVTNYEYDEESRLVQYDIVADDESSDSSSSSDSSAESGSEDSEEDPSYTDNNIDLTVTYTPDGDGNTTTTVIDQEKNRKTETTNAAGLTTSTVDVGTGETDSITVEYIYDSLGRTDIQKFTDGSYIDFDYEGDSQRTSKRIAYKSDGTVESTVEYTYDDHGRTESIICKNSSDTQYCKTEYTYDSEGKVLTESVTYEDKSKQTITYTYDAEGRLESRAYQSSTGLGTMNYAYDTQGNCISINKGSDLVRSYTYDGFGRVDTIKDYDKPGSSSFIQTNYAYDSFGRAVSMVSTNDGNASGIIESLTYTYDKNGNIITYDHVNDLAEVDEAREYTYNDHGDLIQSIKTDNQTNTESVTEYVYDGVGNRVSMTEAGVETIYDYNSVNQLLTVTTGDTEISYEYDGQGNQITATTATLSSEEGTDPTVTEIITTEYAVTGEMTSLTKSNGATTTLTQTNVYNQDGKRISRTQCGTTRSYFYDGGVVAYTEDGSSVSSANILAEDGVAVGTYRGSTYYNYLKDMQGSTTSIVKEDGTLSAAYDYTDFGETTELTGNGFDNQICYTGGIYDEETGLYYLNARYYDPEISRFISQDSYRGELDDPGQWHLYVYCDNNPINYVDPSGHKYGDPYTTKNGAAKNFGKTTNQKSINQDREYASVIYKKKFHIRVQRKKVWVNRFTYTKPKKGSAHSVEVPEPPSGKTVLGILHTHGAYSPGYDNENFSDADKNVARSYGCVIYLVTPGGKLKKFNPKTNVTTIISRNMPRDPNSPD